MSLIALLYLYIAFRLKHFICDFLLQTDWMAATKGKSGQEGYKALFSHTVIHAAGTLLVVMIFAPAFWWLAAVDFAAHSVIDRIKGVINRKKQLGYEDTAFWWAYGLDQEAHNFTHLAYIIVIFTLSGGLAA